MPAMTALLEFRSAFKYAMKKGLGVARRKELIYRRPSMKMAASPILLFLEMHSFSIHGYGVERMARSPITSVIANASSTFS